MWLCTPVTFFAFVSRRRDISLARNLTHLPFGFFFSVWSVCNFKRRREWDRYSFWLLSGIAGYLRKEAGLRVSFVCKLLHDNVIKWKHFPSPLCGEFTCHRGIPLTKASDAELWCFFDLRLNKRLSKQSRRWWFETPSRSLWRHSNGTGAKFARYLWSFYCEELAKNAP